MYRLELHILSLAVLITTMSCEEDYSNMSLPDNLPIPSYACILSFSGSTSSNGTTADVSWKFEPLFLADFDFWKLSIKQVDYYLDDIHQYTATASPYTFRYTASNIPCGTHTVRAVYTITPKNHNNIIIENSKSITVGTDGQGQYLIGNFWVDFDFYIKKGEPLVVTPHIVKEQSAPECRIKKVEYSWNGMLIATKTSEPFSLNYPIDEQEGTCHQLSLNITYGGDGYKDRTCTHNISNISIITRTTDASIFYIMSSVNSKGEYEYKNGDILRGIAKVYLGEDVADSSKSFKLYWDNEIIEDSRVFPHTVNYKLQNQSVGTHELKYEWINLNENGMPVFSFSQTKIINILN